MSGRSSRPVERNHRNKDRRSKDQSCERRSRRSSNTPPLLRRDDRSADYGSRSSRRRKVTRSPQNTLRDHSKNLRERRESSQNLALDRILTRLDAIENKLQQPTASTLDSPSHLLGDHTPVPSVNVAPTPVSDQVTGLADGATLGTTRDTDAGTSADKGVADRIVGALSSLIQVRSHSYYISPFDPNIHDFDMWCAEVDRARQLNNWDDRECLGRIGGCLRGDARSWLNDWISHDRTWTNFKTEFRSLCPRNIDFANILFEVMSTNSNKYSTYAEYARKSLLRLNIVRGLSDELKVSIVIRGIADPQVKAVATNAKLLSKDLVEFLSVYVKPKHDFRVSNNVVRPPNNLGQMHTRKRDAPRSADKLVCHTCGETGHRKWHCPKKPKMDTPSTQDTPSSSKSIQTSTKDKNRSSKFCSFCKRNGHLIESCFLKQRSDNKNSNEVNFCSNPNLDKTM